MSLLQYIAALTHAASELERANRATKDATGIETSARTALVEAAERLVNASRTPRNFLLDLSFQHCATATLQLIIRYRLHHAIPLQGSTTFAQVAKKAIAPGSNIQLVERLLQHAISFGLFASVENGEVAHNDASSLLVNDADLEAWMFLSTNIAYPAGSQIPKALEKYGMSSEPNETAYSISIGRRISQFERFREPDGHAEHEMFARAMKGISAGGAYDVAHVVDGGFPWEDYPHGTLIVDVGGGPGHVSVALARKYPHLRFEVQDLAETAEFGAQHCPKDLQNTVKYRAHDFFKAQPKHDTAGDLPIVFFARFILHDWSDHYATQILAGIAQAMRPQDRLILNEVIVPEPGEMAQHIERRCHDRDLLMLMNLNGRERTLPAFGNLFAAVTPNLRVSRVHRPPGGELSLIEAARVNGANGDLGIATQNGILNHA